MSTELMTELTDALEQLHGGGGTGNRLVVSSGPAWFALSASRGDRHAHCVAAPQRLLKTMRITPEGLIALRMADFAKPRSARALSKMAAIGTAEERLSLAAKLAELLVTAYGQAGDVDVTLRLGEDYALNNEALHAAIRTLASERSQDARQAVYRALLRAQLMMVVDAAGAPLPFGQLGGFHTYAVFTSGEELYLRDPRGLEVSVSPGWAIFPKLAALKPGSLQINPDGRLGGELYRNEVEALARACAGWQKSPHTR